MFAARPSTAERVEKPLACLAVVAQVAVAVEAGFAELVGSAHPVLGRQRPPDSGSPFLGLVVVVEEPLPLVGRFVPPYLQSLQMLIEQFYFVDLRRGSVRVYSC